MYPYVFISCFCMILDGLKNHGFLRNVDVFGISTCLKFDINLECQDVTRDYLIDPTFSIFCSKIASDVF